MQATPRQPSNPKPVIGLLGGPGSGKSTVAGMFAELGCAVIDADRLAHDALEAEAVRAQLKAWWGGKVLHADDTVNRKAVGEIVFQDEAELRRLEGLIHPAVNRARQQEREAYFADPSVVAVVEDCPLLLETGLEQQCDALVFVDCPFDVRLQRLSETRGWDEAELKKREARQIPLDTKRRSADYVISTDATHETVRRQAGSVLQQISR